MIRLAREQLEKLYQEEEKCVIELYEVAYHYDTEAEKDKHSLEMQKEGFKEEGSRFTRETPNGPIQRVATLYTKREVKPIEN